MWRPSVVFCFGLVIAACNSDDRADIGVTVGDAATDAGPGGIDADRTDASDPGDAAPLDRVPPFEAGPDDAEPVDADPLDADPADGDVDPRDADPDPTDADPDPTDADPDPTDADPADADPADADPADAGPVDSGPGDAGTIPCGTATCGAGQICVHPTCGGADIGPCTPPDPFCYDIPASCGSPLTCGCFPSNICDGPGGAFGGGCGRFRDSDQHLDCIAA